MLKRAFKEWAAICRMIDDGRQSVIVRKGGISEAGGEFRPEFDRFWLFPTHLHQAPGSLKADAAALLSQREDEIDLRTFVDVERIFHLDRLDVALALDDLHYWSPETIQQRFHYRKPGLYLLAVRAWRVGVPHRIAKRPEFDGCKTWVDLPEALSIEGSEPVVADMAHQDFARQLRVRLGQS